MGGVHGPRHLRKMTNVVLDALIQAADRSSGGRPVPVEMLQEIVAGLKDSSSFDDFYRRSYDEVTAIVAEEFEQRRTNAFGRLMVHPFEPLFDARALDRAVIGNIFTFLHMVLGEEANACAVRCRDIQSVMRDDLGAAFTWDAFYADPEVKRMYWQVLLRIAESFKRFEPRRDWFIKLMHNRQNAVSLSSNAFYTVEHDVRVEPIIFGEREFAALFHAWFDPLAALSPPDEQVFRRTFGGDPHARIGAFLQRLAGCPVASVEAG